MTPFDLPAFIRCPAPWLLAVLGGCTDPRVITSGDGGAESGASAGSGTEETGSPDVPETPPDLPEEGTSIEPVDCARPSDAMACVPGGWFLRGCIAEVEEFGNCFPETEYGEAELPTFEIDVYEVTVGQYAECVEAGACAPIEQGPLCDVRTDRLGADYPINCVGWDQAVAYCQWTGKRLPTAIEWEKAARGTDGRIFPWGDEAPDCQRAVWWPDYPEGPGPYPAGAGCATGAPLPVGSRPAGVSPYGVHDMGGNVSEWVEDDATNALGDGLKMLRGGAFLHHDAHVMHTWRELGFTAVGEPNMFNGFRCVRGPRTPTPIR